MGAGRRRPSLHAFDLLEIELDGGRTAEDRHADLDARLVEIEFLDNAVERGKRPRVDLDRIADLVIDPDFGLRTRRGLFLAVERFEPACY